MENKSSVNERPFLLQAIWVQAIARSFYQAGHGSILYADFQQAFQQPQLGYHGQWFACRRLRAFSGGYLADSPMGAS